MAAVKGGQRIIDLAFTVKKTSWLEMGGLLFLPNLDYIS